MIKNNHKRDVKKGLNGNVLFNRFKLIDLLTTITGNCEKVAKL